MFGIFPTSIIFIVALQLIEINCIDSDYGLVNRLSLILGATLNSADDTLNLDNTPIDKLVTFWCANPSSPRQQVWVNDPNVQQKINFSLEIVFLTHGWTDSVNRTWVNETMDMYIENVDGNICGVDWNRLASVEYTMAAKNTYIVANYTTIFINYLLAQGASLNSIIVTGHSMGGQISGLIGNNFNGQIPSIIAMDPAGWSYTKPTILPDNLRLTKKSGQFVQVIHTNDNYDGLGVSYPCGHEDYYPNGGQSPQPNCVLPIMQPDAKTIAQLTCSHFSSVQYFMYSENPANKFVGYQCTSYLAYTLGSCKSNPHDNFGLYAKKTATGNLYLRTTANAPFSS